MESAAVEAFERRLEETLLKASTSSFNAGVEFSLSVLQALIEKAEERKVAEKNKTMQSLLECYAFGLTQARDIIVEQRAAIGTKERNDEQAGGSEGLRRPGKN